MRYKSIIISLTLFCVFIICSSVADYYWHYYQYTPIFMTRAALNESVKYISEGKELRNPGKIYIKDSYMFINERYKGIHVFDNSNPANPVNIGFITVPGCLDIAMKGNILYFDNSVDLVAFDFDKKVVTERIHNIFPEPQSPDFYYGYHRDEGMIIVGWKKRQNNSEQ